jgi:hypothetical protein
MTALSVILKAYAAAMIRTSGRRRADGNLTLRGDDVPAGLMPR